MLWVAIGFLGLLAVLWLFGPREPVNLEITFDPNVIGGDVDAYLATREAGVPGITPGAEKRVVWAGAPGEVTDLAVLYVHGFSATSEEIRPVPDRVAAGLGANLVFTRLTGHGRDGPAMAQATAGDWIEDMAEAMEIARRVGRRVVVIATSTGGTLSAIAATDPVLRKALAGIAFMSPNFGLASPAARVLTWPFARVWGPWVAGAERSFAPRNAQHERYWTIRYPSVAVLPMAALVDHAVRLDFGAVTTPALFVFSDADGVVSAARTRSVAARWGAAGLAQLEPQTVPPGNDIYNHVIAGDILSPGMTDRATDTILQWARGL